MINQPLSPLSNKECAVCGTSLPTFNQHVHSQNNSDVDQVCKSPQCQQVMSKKTTMAKPAFEHFLSFQRKFIRDRKEQEAVEKQRVEDLKQKEAATCESIYQDFVAKDKTLDADIIHVVAIPTGLSNTSRPSEERIKQYADNIRALAEQASQYSSASTVPLNDQIETRDKYLRSKARLEQNPHAMSMSDRLCGECKGGCCILGKEKAYLNVLTIRRYMDTRPELGPEDVVTHYVSQIAEETISNSCINQTATGCCLPKDMRSDICNAFYCDPLLEFQQKQDEMDTPLNVLAIRWSNALWNRFDKEHDNKVLNHHLMTPK